MAADAPKEADVAVGSKRKRSMISEDTLVLSSVTDVVNNVVEVIRSTKVDEVHPDLYEAVMFMPGFREEVLHCCFLSSGRQQVSRYILCGDEPFSSHVVA
jgi:hypothetical protein